MFRISHRVTLCGFSLAVLSVLAEAQTSDAMPAAKRGLELASKGRCREALPLLKKAAPTIADGQIKYHTGMATARCAMSLDQTQTAVEALLMLNREFPHDPEVLYISTHFYSELASRASQQLAATAPNSSQAQKLEAEAFESQGNWEKAAAQYNQILEHDPRAPEIHYRLGRLFLSRNPPQSEEAKKEFEQELKIDSTSASSEFMLGEIARQSGQWDEAVMHFTRASQLDSGFVEAYLALGMSLNSAGRFSDAISPLEIYVKAQPVDPAGHYQLATAYARTGRKPEADRQMTLQREAAANRPRSDQH
jgi:tetratricopeptide (TPR) repeat protein